MNTFCRRAAAALVLFLPVACSTAPTPQQRVESTEQSELAPLKKKYPDIVTAFDTFGNRLDLSIDANAYIRTGDDVLDRFRSDASAAWKRAWTKAHPRRHAVLTVRFVDFMRRTWVQENVKA
jgi:hypothetical protein